MRVWLVQYGEPLPLCRYEDRLQRTGTLAYALVRRGHDVVWWTSTFDHYRKKQLFDRTTVYQPTKGLEIRLLRAPGYRNHVSIRRLIHNVALGAAFVRASKDVCLPDVVYCSLPTLELGAAAVGLGRKSGIPVVVDIRDWWPDVFLDILPYRARALAQLALWPMFRMACAACSGATAITGVTPEFVEWGLKKAGRPETRWDRAFPFCYPPDVPAGADLKEAYGRWEQRGLIRGRYDFVACFFGTIGESLDLDTLVEAARLLRRTRRVCFVICGDGDRLGILRDMASDLDNVLLPGWVGTSDIHALMKLSSVGLDPLPRRADFIASINNKAVEYLSAGLPVISSPKEGRLCTLLKQNDCGYSYDTGDAVELASMISCLCERPDALRRLSENAHSTFRLLFDANEVTQQMVDYFEGIAARFARKGE